MNRRGGCGMKGIIVSVFEANFLGGRRHVHCLLVSCWSFKSLKQLRSYQNWYRLVTVHTNYDDFIVLSQWELRPPPQWPDIPLILSYH